LTCIDCEDLETRMVYICANVIVIEPMLYGSVLSVLKNERAERDVGVDVQGR
jgi:hypothetical protein